MYIVKILRGEKKQLYLGQVLSRFFKNIYFLKIIILYMEYYDSIDFCVIIWRLDEPYVCEESIYVVVVHVNQSISM